MSDPNLQQELREAFSVVGRIGSALERTVVGQEHLRRRLITALLTDGHVLIEGVPGLAKTMSIKALASAVQGEFRRIQFTPDLLPADLIGTEVYRPQEGRFEVRKGPVFANFVLADEINRAPAKVQSALLETMQERQVTIGETTYRLPDPFFVMATQNPIEQEGTYPLPEAQIDRFLMKIRVDYPSADEERKMLALVTSSEFAHRNNPPVATLDDIRHARSAVERVYVDEKIRNYIVDLVRATREPEQFQLSIRPLIELGASPRATIALFLVARAEALLAGQYFVNPQNVKDVAADVLRHRIIRSYEAEAQGVTSDELVRMILDGVKVP